MNFAKRWDWKEIYFIKYNYTFYEWLWMSLQTKNSHESSCFGEVETKG